MPQKLHTQLKNLFKHRISILIILILILSGFFIYYADNYPKHSPYNEIKNSNIFVYEGEITSIDSDGFVLTSTQSHIQNLKVKSDTAVSLGDTVQIQGVCISSDNFQINEIVISKNWEYNFEIFRSILGVIILLIIFFWYWKFDLKTFFINRRN